MFNLAWKIKSRLKNSISTFITQRAQRSKKFEISSESENFERVKFSSELPTAISWGNWGGEIETSRLTFSSEIKNFDRDCNFRARVSRFLIVGPSGNSPPKNRGLVARLKISISPENFNPGGRSILIIFFRSEKWQNESSPNFSNFVPEFPPEFCSEFSPNFSRSFRALFPRQRRPDKIHQKSPPFFNAKFPGNYGKNIHKIFLESRQSKYFQALGA